MVRGSGSRNESTSELAGVNGYDGEGGTMIVGGRHVKRRRSACRSPRPARYRLGLSVASATSASPDRAPWPAMVWAPLCRGSIDSPGDTIARPTAYSTRFDRQAAGLGFTSAAVDARWGAAWPADPAATLAALGSRRQAPTRRTARPLGTAMVPETLARAWFAFRPWPWQKTRPARPRRPRPRRAGAGGGGGGPRRRQTRDLSGSARPLPSRSGPATLWAMGAAPLAGAEPTFEEA